MPRGVPNEKMAMHSPVNQPGRELHSDDVAIEQPPRIVLTNDEPIEREEVIIPVSRAGAAQYLEQLAFANDPVTIRIERSSEKFAPHSVDCWVNGIGAELFIKGRWVQCGYLPVGHIVTTKRKYVEVLARSKVDTLSTQVEKHADHEDNIIDRHTSQRSPFSVIRDASPKGAEWLTALLSER